MSYIHACPLCSVVSPPNRAQFHHKTFLCQVQIIRGQRSKLQMLMRPLSCKHVLPFSESRESATELAADWNAWAVGEANAKADRLQFTAEQRKHYLYELGITGHPVIEQPKSL
jgi:hypothetical protein